MGTRNDRPDALNDAVNAVIKEYRDEHLDGSDRRLSRDAGINRATLKRLLDGKTTWDVAYLQQVAEGLSWSVAAIIDKADPVGELTDFTPAARRRRMHVSPLPEDAPSTTADTPSRGPRGGEQTAARRRPKGEPTDEVPGL